MCMAYTLLECSFFTNYLDRALDPFLFEQQEGPGTTIVLQAHGQPFGADGKNTSQCYRSAPQTQCSTRCFTCNGMGRFNRICSRNLQLSTNWGGRWLPSCDEQMLHARANFEPVPLTCRPRMPADVMAHFV